MHMTLCYWLRKTKLIETGGCHGMGMNLKKTKVIRISRQPSPKQMTEQKHPQNVAYFNYLGSIITNIHWKLNTGLTWQKDHPTRGRLFSPANRT
jgi:hypothetical protein